MHFHYLEKLFSPHAIAVIGASERLESVGTRVLKNLLQANFKGKIYAVNPKYTRVQGKPCFSTVTQIKASIDLAIITTPAKAVPAIINDCGQVGITQVLVLSSTLDNALEQSIFSIAKRHSIRILGPNSLGVMRPHLNLNATFDNNTALLGNIALICQSGAVCTGILDWAMHRKIGFSALVSLGNGRDIDFGDVLDYLALDPYTKSILVYIESIHYTRRFMSGLRTAARMKPVIAIKSGKNPKYYHRKRFSSNEILGGYDDVFDIALSRAGVVRVMTIEDLFSAAKILSSKHRVKGNRLMVITNSGAAGVMAADRADELGIELSPLNHKTQLAIRKIVKSPNLSNQNPINLSDEATPERYGAVLAICSQHADVDGILIILVPVAMIDPFKVAKQIVALRKQCQKPILTCWLGEKQVKTAWKLFSKYKIPNFDTPEKAIEAFSYLRNYDQHRQMLMQVPGPLSPQPKPDVASARFIIEAVFKQKRTLLDDFESKKILKIFSIPWVETESLLKGSMIKSSLQLGYNTALMIGVIRDKVFGPVISFGPGGQWLDMMTNQALALPPLNHFIAMQLINQIGIMKLWNPVQASHNHVQGLINILLRVSEMVCELPFIQEMEINPIVVNEFGIGVLSAKISVAPLLPSSLPYSHMAIHPYPSHLVSNWPICNDMTITIRSIRPEDAEMEQEFTRNLSAQSKYFRFMENFGELSLDMLVRFTQIDYDREMALIATYQKNGKETAVGVARYMMNVDRISAEFALVVADDWHKKGIGTKLMTQLAEVARSKGLKSLIGTVLAHNIDMLELTKHLGFVVTKSEDPTIKIVTKILN